MKCDGRTTRQRWLFEPDGPGNIVDGGSRAKELLDLLAQLIREEVTVV